ncbi:MAG: sulfurtransferase TusA family protein [Arenicella sp.]|nr:sulfurtransferase TusA family protein [Arenicella sp.]
MVTNSEIKQTVDTSGTRCPIPLLRAKQALRKLQAGECILVLTTDPSAKADFDAMLKHLPHQLVDYTEGSDTPRVDSFVIRKG